MDATIDTILRGFNVVFVVAIVGVAAIMFTAALRARPGYARADRFSIAVKLPYGDDATRESVAGMLRSRVLVGAAVIGVGGLVGATLLATPLAASAFFPFLVLPALLCASAVGAVVVAVRQRLFRPAPDARRIARVRDLTVASYLDPARRIIPWALGALAVAAFVAMLITGMRAPERLATDAALIATVATAIALLALAAMPALERLVLAQPQPASHGLELAWDDALRADTITSLRLAAAIGSWLALSLAIVALWEGADESVSLMRQLPTWGLLALQLVYPRTGRPLPTPLYPEWLRRPAVGDAR